MEDGYSPWANDSHHDDHDSPPLPAVHTTVTVPVSSSSWMGDDAGGWGSSVDDAEVYMNAVTPSSTAGFEVTTEELDPLPRVASPSPGSEKGWGSPDDTAVSSFNTSNVLRTVDDDDGARDSTPRASSPSLVDHTRNFGSHDDQTSARLPGSTPPLSPRRGSAADSEKSEGGWAVYGSPELPPIASLQIDPSTSSGAGEDTGWAGDAEWQPPEIPEPLPSFGDAFGGKPRRPSTNSGEGWVDPETVSQWKPADETREPAVQSRRASEDRGWDPEAVEQGRMSHMSRQDEENAVEEAGGRIDELQDASSNEPRRDVEGPFRIPPSLLPKLKDGIADAAALSSEALRGASSAAARIGEDIRASMQDTPGAEDSRASEEAKPVARGWFGRGRAPAKPASPKSPPPAPERSRSRSESPDPAPTAVGRFLNRFKRPTNDPVTQAPSKPRRSNEQEPASEPPLSQQPTWQARDLDALESTSSRHNRMFASSSTTAKDDGDGMDDFFGDTRALSGKLPMGEPEDDFGGLLGAFSQPPKKTIKAPKKINKALDPFDPFANDDDDDEGGAGLPAAHPTTPSSRPVYASTSNSLEPPVKAFKTRSLTPEMPVRAVSSVAAFPPPLAAPQARGVASLQSNMSTSTTDADFDSFFNSVTPAVKPSSAPPLGSSSSAPGPQPPPMINVPISSRPARPATISPPPPSHSPISPLAPPPPPSQPVQRGAFGIGPPPSAPLSNASPRPVTLNRSAGPLAPSSAVPTAVKPSAPSPSGPLSKDDFAFFEM